ncbi:Uncharacterised protein [Bifidobacterium pseudocatenulatum]|nr:Uncharacterised protein [Bifidobacterium pseudocatenulatum]
MRLCATLRVVLAKKIFMGVIRKGCAPLATV